PPTAPPQGPGSDSARTGLSASSTCFPPTQLVDGRGDSRSSSPRSLSENCKKRSNSTSTFALEASEPLEAELQTNFSDRLLAFPSKLAADDFGFEEVTASGDHLFPSLHTGPDFGVVAGGDAQPHPAGLERAVREADEHQLRIPIALDGSAGHSNC